ncbi:MAG TPA: metalloregulator ArsR/SmtB family transcription factor, partial [Methylophilaceae bacterium]|nr:metalloregulator ArsR/SmtB family transcription factor [Methylophilaceae bacterium]
GLQFGAKYLKALAEPMRLQVLSVLRDGEKNVSQLKELSGSTQANVSKHLSLLSDYGLVKRESRGNCVYYSIADPSVYDICELVCGQISNRLILEADIKKLFSNAGQSST